PDDLCTRCTCRGALSHRQTGGTVFDAGCHWFVLERDQVFEFFRRLAEANPSPTTELESGNPYQLLVAVVLSAQATDAGVNIATRPLFTRIKTPQQMVDLGEDALRDAIKTIGLFNTKAK